MKLLKYYFLLEFGWNKEKGWMDKGFPRIRIYPTDEFIALNGYVNFEIVESVFLSDSRMQRIDYVSERIKQIENVIMNEAGVLSIFNEVVKLEIKKDFTRPIDNLGDSEGIEAPLSWNISTSEKLQYIPTIEILQIFKDWRSFLIEEENMILIKKMV